MSLTAKGGKLKTPRQRKLHEFDGYGRRKLQSSAECPICGAMVSGTPQELNLHALTCLEQRREIEVPVTSRDASPRPRSWLPASTPARAQPPASEMPIIVHDFVTQEEEQMLLSYMGLSGMTKNWNWAMWKNSTFNGQSRVRSWGAEVDLAKRVVLPGRPLPDEMAPIINRLQELPILCASSWRPDHANAILYERRRGDWLKAHCDDRQLSDDYVVNLSLGGRVTMVYRKENLKMLGPKEVRVDLPPRTLQVMRGLFRYDYTHEIPNDCLHDEWRVSLNFRRCKLNSLDPKQRVLVLESSSSGDGVT